MKKHIITIIFLMILSSLYAHESDLIYRSNTIADIHITIDPIALEWVYGNVDSDSLHLSSIRYQNDSLDISMDSVGFRLRGNTSRDAAKKSFKLDFNEFVAGRELSGVEKLNLKAEQNDPSLIRSNFAFLLMEKIGLSASRTCYARVYINDVYMGLYNIIEHIDENFATYHFGNNNGNLYKCLWPADLKYYGPDPLYHPSATWDPDRPYELKTNISENDHNKLGHLIDIINHTPESTLKDSLESILYITDFIKYLAVNIMTGSWDDYRYLRNNYYLYYDLQSENFRFIPYDYDNTFGIDWVGGSNWGDPNWARINMYSYTAMDSEGRPLADLILNTPEYRNLFTHFIDFYTNNVFREDQWTAYGDSIKTLIRPDVVTDTYYPQDHSFNMNIFDDSYNTNLRYGHVERGLYEFMRKRRESTNEQKNWQTSPASIYYQELVQTGAEATVNASIFHHNGLNNVLLKTFNSNLSLQETYTMSTNTVNGTTRVEEHDRWTKDLSLSSDEIYYKIIAYDGNGTLANWPRNGYAKFKNEGSSNVELFINEFMASNTATIADDANEFDDWVEIYNASTASINLSGMFLTDKADNLDKWNFPEGTTIGTNEYLIVWCDEDGDKTQEGLHANFKLSSGGEFIALVDSDTLSVIDHISFGPQSTDVSFGRETDGGNTWTFFNAPTPGYSNTQTGINPLIPFTNTLYPNYPNPFNPATTISYQLSTSNNIELNIFNAAGHKISTLVNEMQQSGLYKIDWNASHLPSGIYLAVLKVDGNVFDTQKMLLVK